MKAFKFGAGNSFQFAGYSQPEVQYKGNAVKTTARGKRRVTFADGTVVEITYPKYYLRGDKALEAHSSSGKSF